MKADVFLLTKCQNFGSNLKETTPLKSLLKGVRMLMTFLKHKKMLSPLLDSYAAAQLVKVSLFPFTASKLYCASCVQEVFPMDT